jgi:hypothetical protein
MPRIVKRYSLPEYVPVSYIRMVLSTREYLMMGGERTDARVWSSSLLTARLRTSRICTLTMYDTDREDEEQSQRSRRGKSLIVTMYVV